MREYYWLQTEYISGDFSEPKWALHKVSDDTDEIIMWRSYEDTPGYTEADGDPEAEARAVEAYIEEELGFLPEYEVN